MRLLCWTPVLVLVLLCVPACSDAESASLDCKVAPILFGKDEPASLALHAGAQNAVVSILYSGGDVCTGTFVASSAVATAAHCVLEGRTPTIVVGSTVQDAVQRLQPLGKARHPSLDLGLFFVSLEEVLVDITPIPLSSEPLDDARVGSTVEIAGFGVTENGGALVRQFASTVVREVDDASLVVSSEGANGACVGDSGGPVLGNDHAGRVRVLGVLTAGHPSCLARDRYQRVDVAADWWQESGVSDEQQLGCTN